MQDQVIFAARWKSALLLLGCAAFVAFGIVADEPVLLRLIAVGFFGLGILVGLWGVFAPSRLSLGDSGFEVRVLWRTWSVRWADIAAFHLWKVPNSSAQWRVAWNYVPGHGPDTRLRRFSAALGAEAALPGGWSMPPKELCTLMNERLQAATGRLPSMDQS